MAESEASPSENSSTAPQGSLVFQDSPGYPDCSKLSWEEAKLTGISKNQWRKQKRSALKLQKRPIKRKEERERRKQQREVEKRKGTWQPRAPRYNMFNSTNKLTIAIDLDFFNYMSLADSKGSLTQVGHCYSSNRKNPNAVQLYACGVDENVLNIAKTIGAFANWEMHIKSGKIDEVFDKSEIVYLCAESENVLDVLEESKVYVIGGLIDHNCHKGLCYGIAKAKGYAHARLPIDENITLNTRKVLTINQVFDILAEYDKTKDWKQSLLTVIPERKRKHLNNDNDDETNIKEAKVEEVNDNQEKLDDQEVDAETCAEDK